MGQPCNLNSRVYLGVIILQSVCGVCVCVCVCVCVLGCVSRQAEVSFFNSSFFERFAM